MDAFFASVELLRHPGLRGRPLAIGGRGDPDSRAVVTTATYEARQYGIRSGIPMRQAARLCPHCTFLPADFAAYRTYSRRFKQAIRAIAPAMEDRGIDEVYLDLSAETGGSADLARRLKDAVMQATALHCSVAVAPNKLLAKIGSDLDKPDGLTILTMDDVPRRIWPLPVGRINGIGPRARERLQSLGIGTIGELAQVRPARLQASFGPRQAAWLHDAAHGRDDRPVVLQRDAQSRARETTLERDLHPQRHRTQIDACLHALAERLANDLQHDGLTAGRVGIKIRFDDWHTVTRESSPPRQLRTAEELLAAARLGLARVVWSRPVRLIGLRASALEPVRDTMPDGPVARSGTGQLF